MHTLVHAHTHSTLTHTHVHSHICSHTCTLTPSSLYVCVHTQAVFTLMATHGHAFSHSRTHSCSHVYTHTVHTYPTHCRHTRSHTFSLTFVFTHTCTALPSGSCVPPAPRTAQSPCRCTHVPCAHVPCAHAHPGPLVVSPWPCAWLGVTLDTAQLHVAWALSAPQARGTLAITSLRSSARGAQRGATRLTSHRSWAGDSGVSQERGWCRCALPWGPGPDPGPFPELQNGVQPPWMLRAPRRGAGQ